MIQESQWMTLLKERLIGVEICLQPDMPDLFQLALDQVVDELMVVNSRPGENRCFLPQVR
jgi:hypothetical protein